ncbi:hypothetical protein LguiA_006456 [Lonicera macranthoides]
MLKKDPPPWSDDQTTSVQQLKKLTQNLPPLQIPLDGKRILQTDAIDKFWAAILLEETNGKKNVCGYKSGQFKAEEIHYHSTFKEILAVKRGIEKFQFYLVGHHFLVEMDMKAFPKMINFNIKVIPNAQLLRWSQWFAQWSYTVVHLPRKNNVITDFFSRPPQPPSSASLSHIGTMFPHVQKFPLFPHTQHIPQAIPSICPLSYLGITQVLPDFPEIYAPNRMNSNQVFSSSSLPVVTSTDPHPLNNIPILDACFVLPSDVPEQIKYGLDPWYNIGDSQSNELVVHLFNYAEDHFWHTDSQSSDIDMFVGQEDASEDDDLVHNDHYDNH